MAEKRRGKAKKREEGPEKPTKEEYAVAKFLRFNVPTKEGKLVGMTVQYFIASKGIDALLTSKWATSKEPLFTNRSGCVDYCDRLLQKGIFHRAARLEKKKEREKKKPKKLKEDVEESGKEEEKKGKKEKKPKKGKEKEEDKSDRESKVEKEKDSEDGEKETEKKEEEKKDEEKKKKKEKKAKLEMHDKQIFKDGEEVYVWIYDPVPVKTFIIGLMLVLGAIAVCLFPLWPPEVRLGVYYLSLAGAGFVGVILTLCVLRLILFCIIWVATIGKHYFWLLPNLTEDVGFFDSFKPLYKHELSESCTKEKEKDNKKDKDKSKKEKKKLPEEEKSPGGEEKEEEEHKITEKELPAKEGSTKEEEEESGSELDNDNGYEIVEKEEVDQSSTDERDQESEQQDLEPKKTK